MPTSGAMLNCCPAQQQPWIQLGQATWCCAYVWMHESASALKQTNLGPFDDKKGWQLTSGTCWLQRLHLLHTELNSSPCLCRDAPIVLLLLQLQRSVTAACGITPSLLTAHARSLCCCDADSRRALDMAWYLQMHHVLCQQARRVTRSAEQSGFTLTKPRQVAVE